MRKSVILAGALLLAWSCPGFAADKNNKEGDKILKDFVSSMKDATEVLKSVKDEKTAKAAEPKLQKVAEKGQSLQKRLQGLGLSRQELMDLVQKHRQDLQDAQTALNKEAMRVKNVKGGEAALQALTGQKKGAKEKTGTGSGTNKGGKGEG